MTCTPWAIRSSLVCIAVMHHAYRHSLPPSRWVSTRGHCFSFGKSSQTCGEHRVGAGVGPRAGSGMAQGETHPSGQHLSQPCVSPRSPHPAPWGERVVADGDGGVPRSSTAVAGISLQFAGRVYIIPLSRDFRCFGVFFFPFPCLEIHGCWCKFPCASSPCCRWAAVWPLSQVCVGFYFILFL